MASHIHPSAVIEPGAELGLDVEIGPYCFVGAHVKIGDRTRLGPHVVVDGVTRIGAENLIVGQANLGGPPQDLSYKGQPTRLEIGDRNTIREFVTINRGTIKGGGITRIGNDCLLMACCHVAHDCDVQDKVILANCALLAGHVFVGKGANVSGACAAHHFVTIGAYSYIGGMTRINQDVPPFMVYEGHQARVRNVNQVGLERAGFTRDDIEALKHAFRVIYRSGEPRSRTLEQVRADAATRPVVLELVEALEHTEAGRKGRHRESLRETFAKLGAERILGEVKV
ncbi:MAG: acyl-ACP--UDP-N-acetylglucosamine O-acyltransferase [Planctomycetes bacterium]|nr:acyl-ACP--UDP-N-acetylglucosamine O-acyltransferase [Planctomycetota bacterium]